MRPSGRVNDEMRQVKLSRNYTMHVEGHAYSCDVMNAMLDLAEKGINEIIVVQDEVLKS